MNHYEKTEGAAICYNAFRNLLVDLIFRFGESQGYQTPTTVAITTICEKPLQE